MFGQLKGNSCEEKEPLCKYLATSISMNEQNYQSLIEKILSIDAICKFFNFLQSCIDTTATKYAITKPFNFFNCDFYL